MEYRRKPVATTSPAKGAREVAMCKARFCMTTPSKRYINDLVGEVQRNLLSPPKEKRGATVAKTSTNKTARSRPRFVPIAAEVTKSKPRKYRSPTLAPPPSPTRCSPVRKPRTETATTSTKALKRQTEAREKVVLKNIAIAIGNLENENYQPSSTSHETKKLAARSKSPRKLSNKERLERKKDCYKAIFDTMKDLLQDESMKTSDIAQEFIESIQGVQSHRQKLRIASDDDLPPQQSNLAKSEDEHLRQESSDYQLFDGLQMVLNSDVTPQNSSNESMDVTSKTKSILKKSKATVFNRLQKLVKSNITPKNSCIDFTPKTKSILKKSKEVSKQKNILKNTQNSGRCYDVVASPKRVLKRKTNAQSTNQTTEPPKSGIKPTTRIHIINGQLVREEFCSPSIVLSNLDKSHNIMDMPDYSSSSIKKVWGRPSTSRAVAPTYKCFPKYTQKPAKGLMKQTRERTTTSLEYKGNSSKTKRSIDDDMRETSSEYMEHTVDLDITDNKSAQENTTKIKNESVAPVVIEDQGCTENQQDLKQKSSQWSIISLKDNESAQLDFKSKPATVEKVFPQKEGQEHEIIPNSLEKELTEELSNYLQALAVAKTQILPDKQKQEECRMESPNTKSENVHSAHKMVQKKALVQPDSKPVADNGYDTDSKITKPKVESSGDGHQLEQADSKPTVDIPKPIEATKQKMVETLACRKVSSALLVAEDVKSTEIRELSQQQMPIANEVIIGLKTNMVNIAVQFPSSGNLLASLLPQTSEGSENCMLQSDSCMSWSTPFNEASSGLLKEDKKTVLELPVEILTSQIELQCGNNCPMAMTSKQSDECNSLQSFGFKENQNNENTTQQQNDDMPLTDAEILLNGPTDSNQQNLMKISDELNGNCVSENDDVEPLPTLAACLLMAADDKALSPIMYNEATVGHYGLESASTFPMVDIEEITFNQQNYIDVIDTPICVVPTSSVVSDNTRCKALNKQPFAPVNEIQSMTILNQCKGATKTILIPHSDSLKDDQVKISEKRCEEFTYKENKSPRIENSLTQQSQHVSCKQQHKEILKKPCICTYHPQSALETFNNQDDSFLHEHTTEMSTTPQVARSKKNTSHGLNCNCSCSHSSPNYVETFNQPCDCSACQTNRMDNNEQYYLNMTNEQFTSNKRFIATGIAKEKRNVETCKWHHSYQDNDAQRSNNKYGANCTTERGYMKTSYTRSSDHTKQQNSFKTQSIKKIRCNPAFFANNAECNINKTCTCTCCAVTKPVNKNRSKRNLEINNRGKHFIVDENHGKTLYSRPCTCSAIQQNYATALNQPCHCYQEYCTENTPKMEEFSVLKRRSKHHPRETLHKHIDQCGIMPVTADGMRCKGGYSSNFHRLVKPTNRPTTYYDCDDIDEESMKYFNKVDESEVKFFDLSETSNESRVENKHSQTLMDPFKDSKKVDKFYDLNTDSSNMSIVVPAVDSSASKSNASAAVDMAIVNPNVDRPKRYNSWLYRIILTFSLILLYFGTLFFRQKYHNAEDE